MVRTIIKLEAFVFLLGSIFLYYVTDGGWFLFFILFFAPDISMIGYLKNKSIGSIVYNLGHTYVLAGVLIFLGVLLQIPLLTHLGIIVSAHASLDRLLGFGLKYPSDFKDTHIQKI